MTTRDIERRLEEKESGTGTGEDGVTDAALGVTAPFVTYEGDGEGPATYQVVGEGDI